MLRFREWRTGIFFTVRIALLITFGALIVRAGDFSTYRDFQLGSDIAAVAKQAGKNPSDARLVHQRPATIQEMDWQPRGAILSDASESEPVQSGLLSFYNGELFRISVTYDRYRIAGLTTEDLIEGISQTYGASTRPIAEIAYHSVYGEKAKVIARWENPQYEYDLIRTGDQRSFALVVTSKRLDALAQAAISESVRLDAQEAPQREIDKEKARASEERLTLEKARSANKPNFRP